MTSSAPSPVTTGYAPVNGLQLYYEIHGSGDPLVVVHGGLGYVGMFGPTLAALAAERQVIGVELQGHGHTADIDRPFGYESFGDDVAALIGHLGFEAADVLGYSVGGGVALQTASRHPLRVRRLVLAGAPFRQDGWFPEVVEGFAHIGPQLAEMMKASPVYKHYASIAPRPQDFARLLEKTGELQRRDYDWSDRIAGLPPTLLVFGDADSVRPQHVVDFYAKLGGGLRDPGWDGSGERSASQLAILPGATHYDLAIQPAFAATVARFLSSAPR